MHPFYRVSATRVDLFIFFCLQIQGIGLGRTAMPCHACHATLGSGFNVPDAEVSAIWIVIVLSATSVTVLGDRWKKPLGRYLHLHTYSSDSLVRATVPPILHGG